MDAFLSVVHCERRHERERKQSGKTRHLIEARLGGHVYQARYADEAGMSKRADAQYEVVRHNAQYHIELDELCTQCSRQRLASSELGAVALLGAGEAHTDIISMMAN
jgi:hypothetical protein